MKHILILLMLNVNSVITANAQTDEERRVQFFPRIEQKVVAVPGKDNVWVFLLAGQSNMAGRGLVEPQDTVPSERILTINKNGDVIAAKEPLHFYEPTRTGLDCGLSFARELLTHIPDSITILLLPTAVGGSSISQWLGDSVYRNVRLLTNFSEIAALGKKYGSIRGILWHQGESDAKESTIPYYKERLQKLSARFRAIAGNDRLPILIGELGAYSETSEVWTKINEQIHDYALTDKNVSVISTADLLDKGDKVHFNAEGQRILGRRMALEYLIRFQRSVY